MSALPPLGPWSREAAVRRALRSLLALIDAVEACDEHCVPPSAGVSDCHHGRWKRVVAEARRALEGDGAAVETNGMEN